MIDKANWCGKNNAVHYPSGRPLRPLWSYTVNHVQARVLQIWAMSVTHLCLGAISKSSRHQGRKPGVENVTKQLTFHLVSPSGRHLGHALVANPILVNLSPLPLVGSDSPSCVSVTYTSRVKRTTWCKCLEAALSCPGPRALEIKKKIAAYTSGKQ